MSLKELQKPEGPPGLLLSSTLPSPNILLGLFQAAPDCKPRKIKVEGKRCALSPGASPGSDWPPHFQLFTLLSRYRGGCSGFQSSWRERGLQGFFYAGIRIRKENIPRPEQWRPLLLTRLGTSALSRGQAGRGWQALQTGAWLPSAVAITWEGAWERGCGGLGGDDGVAMRVMVCGF